jgi:hypothetical protein
MLTVDKLKAMQPSTIFATGEILDNPQGLNMTNSNKRLRWVAVRGGIHDWAIYCHWAEHDQEWIKSQGDKVYNKHNIKRLVECDDEAFKMYRY